MTFKPSIYDMKREQFAEFVISFVTSTSLKGNTTYIFDNLIKDKVLTIQTMINYNTLRVS